MKARVLSLILLAAMLITAIPVAVSAEENDVATVLPESVTNPELADLHDYYVQDGLVALFSGFDGDTVDFEGGIWQNKVKDGANATFRDAETKYWEMQNGGIGYTMLSTEWDADAQKVGISLPDAYEHLDNYTVEAFATVVGITDENGDRFVNHYQAAVKDEAGNIVTPASGRQYGWYKSGAKASSAFRFGLLCSLFFCSLMDNATANDSIGSRWFICNYGYVGSEPSGDKGYKILDEAGWRKMGTPTVPVAGTMQVYKTTTTVTDGDTSVTNVNHRLTYNGGADVFDKTFTKEQEAIYLSQSSTDLSSRFSLFNALPSTVYSIRVYEKVLTAEEKLHNRAVDVMLYYGLEIPASVVDAIEDYLIAQATSVEFLTYGSEAYDAKKAELQAMVDSRAEAEKIISLYAQRDHLTSFFTVYHEGTLNMTAGTWSDLIGGGTAEMGVPSRWFVNADGSFGYNAFVGYVDADGNPSTLGGSVNADKTAIDALGNVPTANHAYWKNNELSFGIDKLPADDFTFEYMAMYRPLLVADAAKSTSTNLVYATDADGNLLEAYKVFGSTPATTDYGSSSGRAVDVVGHFTTITQQIDGSSGWGGSVRGTQHWMYDTFYWSSVRNWVGSVGGYAANSGLAVSGDPFKKNDVVTVYAITLDETVTADSATGNFGLYRNGTLYKENNGSITWASASGAYNPEFTDSCQFYLSCCQPIDFYGARVYDIVLNEAEKKQNVAIDLILYYGLDVSAVRDDADAMASILTILAGETFLTDASAKTARAAYLQFAIDRAANDFVEKYAASENLTALFTTFVPASVNLAAGTWTDMIGGKTATLGTASKWSWGEYGGIGFNAYYGMIDENGAFTTTSDYNYYNKVDMRLQFGISLLPADDFTVEYLAMYKPIYVTDTAGAIAKDANGNRIETYTANGNTPGGMAGTVASPVDSVGFFQAFTNNVDGDYGGWGRGGLAWFFNNPSWYSGRNGKNMGLYKSTDPFQQNNVINTYGIYVDESYDATTDVTSALFGLYRGATAYADNGGQNSTANDSTSTYAYFAQGTGYSGFNFWLSASRPTDFFSVRIYDKVLTEAERQQNRAVDVIYYYGLEVDDKTWADDDAMQDIYTALCDEAFLTDASAKALKKYELQLIVDGSSLKEEMLALYARPESMTHLYTTFAFDSVDLTNGTWADLLSDATASLGDKGQWKVGEHGGVGFNIFRGNMEDTDGDGYKETFNPELVVGQNYHNTAIRLHFGIAQLPEHDFTVDYLAMYKPVYIYDADETDKIARDQSGKKLEVYNFDLTATAGHYDYEIDQLGWFTNIASALDGKDQNWSGTTRGATHWMFNNPQWYFGNNGSWIGTDWNGNTGGLAVTGNPYHTFGEIHSYAITLDETLTVAEDATRTTTATFALYRDAAIYNKYDSFSTANNAEGVALNKIAQDGYFDYDQSWYDIDNSGAVDQSFWLSSTRPTDFYTVRIYDVALTDDEKAQNLFVDMLYYYDVEIPETLKGNTEKLIELAKATATLGFATDASAKATNKTAIEAAIDNLSKTVTIQFKTETLDTVKILNDTFTLPTMVDGNLVIGWQVNGAASNYVPGTEIDVTEDMNLEPTIFTVPETRLAPSIKVTEKAEDLGMRFTAELYRADYETIVALYGKGNIRLGMLITPDAYVQRAGAFTRKALTDMVSRSGSTSGAAYIQIDATGFYTVGERVLTIAGTVNNFKANTFKMNPAFAAIAFLDVDTDGDGYYDFTVYGNYNPNASATVTDGMTNARPSMTDTQKGWIDTLLKQFGA